MLCDDERPEGHICVHFTDNTYKKLALKGDTTVNAIIEFLCQWLSRKTGGREADPSRHELLIIAPGNSTLRERLLLREDKPLQIQAKGGGAAYKFLFKEVHPTSKEDRAHEGGVGDAVPPTASGPLPPVPATSGHIRTGTLERHAAETDTWHPCTVILDEDRLWYSPVPSAVNGSVGGGMESILLSECDKPHECEDKRVLQLAMKDTMTKLRARSAQERNSWLVAIVKQAALIKEQDILLQAEKIISKMELKRSQQQFARLETLGHLQGVLSMPQTRELFIHFARREYEAAQNKQSNDVDGNGAAATSWWPEDVSVEALIACLQHHSAAQEVEGEHAGNDIAAWTFSQGPLFEKFQEHPSSQCEIFKIAAGIA